ncbi:MAG: lipopolysaccharide biosynthesis protein [Dehalococcoidia bacterium]
MVKAVNLWKGTGWPIPTVRQAVRRLGAPGHFVRSVALLAGSAALGQAVLILASPVLTRLYSPDDFGVLAVFTSVIYMLAGITALRYQLGIPLPEDDETAASLLVLCLIVVVGTSSLIAIMVWALGAQITQWTNVPELRPYLWLLPISLFGAGVYLTFTAWGIRKGAFRQMARTRISQGVVPTALQLALGFAHVGTPGLLFGAAAGQAAGSETLIGLAWRRSGEAFHRVTPQRIRYVASHYRRFPLFGAPGVLLSSVGLSLPMFVLAALYNPQVVGWYALAQRVVARPLEFIVLAVAQVYLSQSAKVASSRVQDLPKMVAKVLGGMALVVVPYILVLVLVARWLFPLVFGAEWAEAGLYAQVLSIMLVVQMIVAPIGDTLDVLQRQDLYFVREVIRIILLAGAISIAAIFSLRPAAAVLLLSIAGALTYLIFLGIALHAIRARLRAIEAGHAA